MAYQKLYANTDLLAELLCEPMPELPIDDVVKRDEDTVNVDMYTPSGRFEDVSPFVIFFTDCALSVRIVF